MTAIELRGRWQLVPTALLWVAVPCLANLLVALRYRRAWYTLDEWSLIGQIFNSHSIGSYFLGYNGHLYVVPRVVYAIQLYWIGTPDHAFIWATFCVALLAWTYATAILLRTLGVPSLVAVVAGVMAVYFGPGSGLDTFEINLATDLAIACSLFAGAVAVRRHPAGHWDAVAVALLLCVATSSDGGAAVSGIVFVSALVLFRWSWIDTAIGLAPPVLYAGWAAVTQAGPKWPANLWVDIQFSVKLVLLASGGLVGSTVIGGIVLLVAAAAVVVLGYRRGALGGTVGRSLLAGWMAALFTVGALAHTRAGLLRTDFSSYDRYVAEVAIFILVALLPSLWATVMAYLPERRTVMAGGTAALLVAVFILNLGPLFRGFHDIEVYEAMTREQFSTAVGVSLARCPDGAPTPDGFVPLAKVDPQLTAGYIRQLRSYGLFTSIPPEAPAPGILEAACSSAG